MGGRPSSASNGRAWWKVFGLLAVAGAAWALAMPLMSGPDEADQATRAAAVARGHPFAASPTRNDRIAVYVEAPHAYQSAHEMGLCYSLMGRPHRSVLDESIVQEPEAGSCREMADDQDVEAVWTNEFRGQPLYYFLVGLPTLVAGGGTGAYLMRIVAVGLCSAFLASGFLSLTRLRRPRLAVLGGAVLLTPSVLYFAATVNPVGLEVATAFGAWAGFLALVRGRPASAAETSQLVRRTGLALAVLAVTRPLSPGFALVLLLVGALVAPPGRVRDLLQRRDVRRWLAAAAVGTVLTAAWIVDVRLSFPFRTLGGSGLAFALEQIPWWGREMVGIFGPTTVAPPAIVHLLWLGVVVAVVGLAWRHASPRHLRLVGGLALGTVALLVAGEGFNVPPTNVWWQGRYVLPLVIGCVLVPLVGGRQRHTGPSNGTPDAPGDLERRLGPPAFALLVALQVWSFAYALRHFTVGPDGTANPLSFLFDAEWSPPLLPPWAYVVVLTLGLTLLSRVLWTMASTASSWDPSAALVTVTDAPAGAVDAQADIGVMAGILDGNGSDRNSTGAEPHHPPAASDGDDHTATPHQPAAANGGDAHTATPHEPTVVGSDGRSTATATSGQATTP